MIYGVYDAVHTVIDPVTGAHQLAIEFAGRVFVLGVDPELTVNGNAWVLDLSNWPNTHPGDTTLVIERGKTYLGEITSSTILRIDLLIYYFTFLMLIAYSLF